MWRDPATEQSLFAKTEVKDESRAILLNLKERAAGNKKRKQDQQINKQSSSASAKATDRRDEKPSAKRAAGTGAANSE